MKDELIKFYKEYQEALKTHIMATAVHEDQFHDMSFGCFMEWLENGFSRCKYMD